MRIICLLTILSLSLLFVGCSSDDLVAVDEQPTHIPAGAYEEECKWIYAQMNHDYLWREDLPDSASCDYGTDPVTFFKSLLSDKDRFSYCERNTSYSPPAEIVNMGFEYQMYSSGADEFAQVLYVTSQELKRQGLRRGDLVKFDKARIFRGELRGNNFIPTDTLEAVEPQGQTSTVYLDSIYYVESKKVGYMCYLEFDDTQDLLPVLRKFYDEHIDELVLDLRYNPGGYVSTCKYLTNSIVSEQGYGGIFQQCTYNDVLSREYEAATGSSMTVSTYRKPNNGNTLPGSEMYGLNLKCVYVLTSRNTASASEAAIICLRPFTDVIVIGEQTVGKGVGSWTIRDERYKYQLQPITMRYHNALMETTPDEGLTPHYYIPDGYSTAKRDLGDTAEPLLQCALNQIRMGEWEMYQGAADATRTAGLEPVGEPSFVTSFRLRRGGGAVR